MSSTMGTLKTGALAALATTAVAALRGRAESRSAVGPINAVSHIPWGEGAAWKDDVDIKHTGTGLLLNALAVSGWAGVHKLFFQGTTDRSVPAALARGAMTSALAYITDYALVPKRLTPGFEYRLSNRSLLMIYAALAASFAAGELLFDDDGDSTETKDAEASFEEAHYYPSYAQESMFEREEFPINAV